MSTGFKAGEAVDAEEPLRNDPAALTLPADVDSVPSFSSVVETRTASGQRHRSRPEFDGGPAIGDDVAGHYRVLGVLGEGGMGRVYECENHRTGRRVALKWVPAVQAGGADAIARFAREARIAGHVEHPNVIDIYDVVEEGPATFLVMELLKGQSLAEQLEITPRLPVEVAMDIMIEAARGISAAHAAGVVHRDLKPDNLFLCEGKSVGVKVVDFGVSKRMGSEAELSLTQTGAVVGTPYYMAPEQMRGRRDLDHRLDIYAMGAILYEMLAGVQPYRADTLGALAIKVATEDPAPLSSFRDDLPEGLEIVIRHAMARDREQRFDDVEQLAHALEPFGLLPFASDRPGSYSGSVRFEISSSDLSLPRRGSSLSDNAVTLAARVPSSPPQNAPRRRSWLLPALGVSLVSALALGWVYLGPSAELADTPVNVTPATESPATESPATESPATESPAQAPEGAPEVHGDEARLAPPALELAASDSVPAASTDAGAALPEASVRSGAAADSTPRSSSMRHGRSSSRMHVSRASGMGMTVPSRDDATTTAEPVEPDSPMSMVVTHRAGELGVDDF